MMEGNIKAILQLIIHQERGSMLPFDSLISEAVHVILLEKILQSNL